MALTVLALLLERVAEHACGDPWRNIRDEDGEVVAMELYAPARVLVV